MRKVCGICLLMLLVMVFATPQPTIGAALPDMVCDRLTFVKGRDVYLIEPDGTGQIRLISSPRSLWARPSAYTGPDYMRLEWSPDGTALAFLAQDHQDFYPYLYVVKANGTDIRMLTQIHERSIWYWAPDSEHIVITTNYRGIPNSFEVIHSETAEVVCSSSFDLYKPPVCTLLNTFDAVNEEWFPSFLAQALPNSECLKSPNGYWMACQHERNTGIQITDLGTEQSVLVNGQVDHFFWTPACQMIKGGIGISD